MYLFGAFIVLGLPVILVISVTDADNGSDFDGDQEEEELANLGSSSNPTSEPEISDSPRERPAMDLLKPEVPYQMDQDPPDDSLELEYEPDPDPDPTDQGPEMTMVDQPEKTEFPANGKPEMTNGTRPKSGLHRAQKSPEMIVIPQGKSDLILTEEDFKRNSFQRELFSENPTTKHEIQEKICDNLKVNLTRIRNYEKVDNNFI